MSEIDTYPEPVLYISVMENIAFYRTISYTEKLIVNCHSVPCTNHIRKHKCKDTPSFVSQGHEQTIVKIKHLPFKSAILIFSHHLVSVAILYPPKTKQKLK